ncbi:MAG TPA: glycosyltransferase family 1 protein [Burkholderiales bacterium]|nr:glycosyltransferase family 1 protein [Burkholderiales bacterium]
MSSVPFDPTLHGCWKNKQMLRIGVYKPDDIPQSFRVYAANVERHLPENGMELVPFSTPERIPSEVELLWDIRSGGGNPPLEFMMGGPPLVVTVYGFAPITLSGWEYFRSAKGVLMSRHYAKKKLKEWRRLKDGISSVITISNHTKDELIQFAGIPEDRIHVCHLAVDAESFPPVAGSRSGNYFLHISNDEPRKNLGRILKAFGKLRKRHGIELVLKLPADRAGKYSGIDGVRTIGGLLSTEELAELYRNALGFVFPSLYEGFGMPILEAMASGCPVITSNVSACPEVAGNAALLVDPRSAEAIFNAMETLCLKDEARRKLADAGLSRVRSFSWQQSAACHARVFSSLVSAQGSS